VSVVCTGRPVSRFDNRPVGDECGAEYPGGEESARVAGWRVGRLRPDGTRPAMCPRCARASGQDETPPVVVLEPLPGL
jgi:hypothetical protein